MVRTGSALAVRFDVAVGGGGKRLAGLRLAASGALRGPEKYRLLDLKRRRAQIRARRLRGWVG